MKEIEEFLQFEEISSKLKDFLQSFQTAKNSNYQKS